DIATLSALFEERLLEFGEASRPPFWLARLTAARIEEARALLSRIAASVAPLVALRAEQEAEFSVLVRASVTALEALGRTADGALATLYGGDAGEKLVGLLRDLVAATASFALAPQEWPDVMQALVAAETVKPSQG